MLIVIVADRKVTVWSCLQNLWHNREDLWHNRVCTWLETTACSPRRIGCGSFKYELIVV
jgi:hypothetical protein